MVPDPNLMQPGFNIRHENKISVHSYAKYCRCPWSLVVSYKKSLLCIKVRPAAQYALTQRRLRWQLFKLEPGSRLRLQVMCQADANSQKPIEDHLQQTAAYLHAFGPPSQSISGISLLSGALEADLQPSRYWMGIAYPLVHYAPPIWLIPFVAFTSSIAKLWPDPPPLSSLPFLPFLAKMAHCHLCPPCLTSIPRHLLILLG